MLNKENFKLQFGDWFPLMEKLFDNGTMDSIYGTLKTEGSRMSISPLSSDTYKAFEKCKRSELKCVFLGLAPYASFTYDNKPVSDGLAFSCSVTNKEQPSLKLVWDAIFDDLNTEGKRYTDLSYLAHQGVLMLNVALTAKRDKPESHIALWQPFMKYLFEEVLSLHTGLPIIYFGKQAAKMKSFSLPFGHYNKIVEHPAAAARDNRPFNHENIFTWINNLLKENNNQQIKWIVNESEHEQIID